MGWVFVIVGVWIVSGVIATRWLSSRDRRCCCESVLLPDGMDFYCDMPRVYLADPIIHERYRCFPIREKIVR